MVDRGLMSNLTLEKKDSEIEILRDELDTMKTNKLHSCQECSRSFASETELKSHLCAHCNYTFAGEHKLKSHMWRINLNNPVSEQFGF